ncbi:putative metallo-hydrolase [Anaerotignum neopropionicum]|uniref:Putative metallo-hydrolase n=1 Tax=Anaerotignum neopropionicum TaxID=36847 RepID=A0A136WHL1_9FIRM|nr:MBL fold metallo-hydrolase [Anaerotignum neopropionicum]KXL53934.1 putative metallo-hydrolase [Anaerotignum neopropionicum]
MKIKTLPMGSIGTNCYVVSDDAGNAVIIDCDGDPRPLYFYISENNLTPTHILLTHGHYDHIGAVAAVKEQYGCKVIAGKDEIRVLTDPAVNCSVFCGGEITVFPDELVSDGDSITVGDMKFEVLFTPGHTEGSLCYIIEDIIFSGDTLFQGSCGRTDLATGDWSTILRSLKLLRDLPGDYTVYPGHGPSTTLGIERSSNPYM